MKRLLFPVVLFLTAMTWAQGPLSGANGDCTIGGQQVLVNGLASTGTQPIGTTTVSVGSGVLASYPNCSVTVFLSGTITKASIFSNNPSSSPNPLGNPFTANTDGSWLFFAGPACYDITVGTGTGPTMPASRTYTDVCLSGIGAGTVQSFSADATVGTLFSTTVASPTTNPALHFSLLPAPGYYVFGNNQSTPSTGQYVPIIAAMLPFTYSGNTSELATTLTLSNVAGTEICEDALGNLKDSGCSNASAGVTSFNGRTGAVIAQTGDYTVSEVTGAAPLASPNFSGTPTTPTPSGGDTSTQVTNDAWVSTYFAVLASPAFTGVPTAPTAAVNTSTTQLATTAFVIAQLGAGGYAPLNSPAFTGVPTAPTAAPNTNTTQLATTAFVVGQASSTVPIVDGTGTIGVSLTYARADHVHPTDNTRAPLNNPNFTGNVGLGTGELLDSTNSPGSSGQFLKTTGSTTLWATISGSGTVTSVDGSASEGAETVVSGAISAITTAGTIRATDPWVTVTGPQTLVDANRGQAWLSNDAGSDVYTLPTPSGSNFQNGWYLWLKNGSTTGTITLTPAGATTIDGASTLVVQTHSVVLFGSDGTNYHTLIFSAVGNNAANLVFASPCGTSGTPNLRALCSADIPASVALTGAPTSTTPTTADNSTKIATTAFVQANLANYAPLSSPTFTGTVTIPTAAVTTFSGTPNFSGAATGQTATTSDNSTKLATTAFVQAAIAAGALVTSVSNSDGTLTISPTTGAVVASLALGHTNTWTVAQTFGTITPTTISGNPNFSGAPNLAAFLTATGNMILEPATGDTLEISINSAGGTAAAPALTSAESSTTGIFWISSTTMSVSVSGTERARFGANALSLGPTGITGGTNEASTDISLLRGAANRWDVGSSTTTSDTTGSIRLSSIQIAGTKFTLSTNACSATTTLGGATAGSFASGTTGTCTVTITMGDTDTAPNGWHCTFEDHTTPANFLSATGAASTTTCSMTGTTVSGDLITFGAIAY